MFPGNISEDGMPDDTYVKRRPGVKLTAYNSGSIEQYGSIEFQCSHGSSGWQTHAFFVEESSGPAILALRNCQQLELVSLKCDSVNSSQTPTFKVTLPNLKKPTAVFVCVWTPKTWIKYFNSRKCIWKCRLRNGIHLSQPQCVNNAKVFSKLDAKNGYWSIRLDEASLKLTTFNTPFGRYRFLRLPFGLVLS